MILHCLWHTLKHCLIMLPILFLVYILIAYFFHRQDRKYTNIIKRSKKASVLIGATLGIFPQCGFSAVMADLYSEKNISIGTLVAVFLATSDEAIPLMVSNVNYILPMLALIGIKFVSAIMFGYLIDFIFTKIIYRNKNKLKTAPVSINNSEVSDTQETEEHNHDHNHEEPIYDATGKQIEHPIHCDCDGHDHEINEKNKSHCCADNIFLDALKHTINIFLFIFIVSFAINLLVEYIGEDSLKNLFGTNTYLQVLTASVVGLIPNCIASVVLVELFTKGALSFGALIAGLSVGAGVGYLVLFRKNKKILNSLLVVGITFACGLILGMIVNSIELLIL